MASVTSQLIEEVTAHAQSDSLEDAREICADGTYFPNKLRIWKAEDKQKKRKVKKWKRRRRWSLKGNIKRYVEEKKTNNISFDVCVCERASLMQ